MKHKFIIGEKYKVLDLHTKDSYREKGCVGMILTHKKVLGEFDHFGGRYFLKGETYPVLKQVSTGVIIEGEKEVVASDSHFDMQYTMVKNHFDEAAAWDGCMFETYGEELEHVFEVAKKTPKKVWTILDADGDTYLVAGFHFVNRLGFIITEQDWDSELEQYKDIF